MTNQLAIIIPAYKKKFLSKALDSIAIQSCKKFTLYIGDDNSPYDLEEVIRDYQDKILIVYKKFNDNLGGRDLVAHWTRCIALSGQEEWIWLFSDDDEMDADCVARFYQALELTNAVYSIYHFDVDVIDEESNCISHSALYPPLLNSFEYYKRKMDGSISSLVVENIFSRRIYEEMGGFQKFDLAWGSDTASWVKFSLRSGMYSIQTDCRIRWRQSRYNITPDKTLAISIRKMNALVDFLIWAKEFFRHQGYSCLFINYKAFVGRMRVFRRYVPSSCLNECVKRFCISHQFPHLYGITRFLIKL